MTALLSRLRAFDRRRPALWDVVVAVVCGAASVSASPHLGAAGVAWVVIVTCAVAFRRRYPLPALLVAFACVLAATGAALVTTAQLPWTYLAIWVLLFGVGLRERRPAIGLVTAIIAVTALTALGAQSGDGALTDGERVRGALAVLGMCAAAFLLGLQIRTRRDQVAAEQAEAAHTAVVAERSRIAQEMHDIIGHNLSVITSLANGGAVAVRRSPDDAVEAFHAIGRVSRGSVRDVRRVLAVLRQDHTSDGASLVPQPGLDDLPALVASVEEAGADVRLELSGDLTGLSAARQLAVYRLVQESLTNVLRHAGRRARVDVRVCEDGDGTVVVVSDDGQGPGSLTAPGGPVAGHGILGMRERVQGFGGTLSAGPSGDGWTVHAQIPSDPRKDHP
jgi:signal transduction histidine kinase